MLVFANVLGALKEHVLEEVGKATFARRLIAASDVVPDVDRDQRNALVLVKDDFKPIVELVLLKGELRIFCRSCTWKCEPQCECDAKGRERLFRIHSAYLSICETWG